MFASDTPLVPEDQGYVRDSIPRDLDQDREPIAQRMWHVGLDRRQFVQERSL